MADCPSLATCPFFNDRMKNLPGFIEVFKTIYCTKDNANCARFIIAQKLGKDKVPADLFPNETVKAMLLLKNAGL